MEQPPAAAAIALDLIQQLPSHSGTPLSGIPAQLRKLFETEIGKHQGQIISHASGALVALFPRPVRAVICAISLHRMFAVLSQSLAELESFRLRIGIHAEATTDDDDTQAQQKCIAVAHELKELAKRGNILVSRAVASRFDETGQVKLRPALEYKPVTAARSFDIFELIPPPIKPLPAIETSRRLARLRLPLAAAFALFIMSGTGYGYLYQTGAVEWPPAPGLWLEKARKATQQQIDSSIGSLERGVRAIVHREPPISRGEALQKAAASIPIESSLKNDAVSIASAKPSLSRGEALQKSAASRLEPIEPSPSSAAVRIAAMEEPAEDTVVSQPTKPGSQQSAPLPERKTARQQHATSATEAAVKPKATLPVHEVPVPAPEQPEQQPQPQQQNLKAESTQIAPASALEKPVAPQARPAPSVSAAPSEPPAPDPTANSPTAKPESLLQKQQKPKGVSAVSMQKPSAPPEQISQSPLPPLVQQTEQVASISRAVGDQATLARPSAAEGSVTVLLQGPTFGKSPARAPQNTAEATEKLLELEQVPSAAAPQAEPPKRQAALSPAQVDISAPEQPNTETPVKSAPMVASLATEKATGNETMPQALAPVKPRATKVRPEIKAVEVQMQTCKALRKAFRRGTLVRSVDKAAYRLLVACEQRKNDRNQGRIASKASNQGTNQSGSDGGTTGGSTSGPGNSGGKGNGNGRNK
jgi:hypothetical protein